MGDPILNIPRLPFYQKRYNVHIPKNVKSKKYFDGDWISWGPFNPASLSPRAFYDFSDTSNLFQGIGSPTIPVTALNDPVGYVSDLGPYGNYLTTDDVFNRPVYVESSGNTNGARGINTVRSNQEYLYSDPINFGPTLVIIFVAISISPGPLIRVEGLSSPDFIVTYLQGGDKQAVQVNYGTGQQNQFFPGFNTSFAVRTIYLDGTTFSIRQNKLPAGTITLAEQPNFPDGRVLIGYNGDTTYCDADVFGIFVASPAPSMANIARVEQWMADKYGIVV